MTSECPLPGPVLHHLISHWERPSIDDLTHHSHTGTKLLHHSLAGANKDPNITEAYLHVQVWSKYDQASFTASCKCDTPPPSS